MQKFFCENCGRQVDKNELRCPGCGRYFKSVKCPSCGLAGSPDLFLDGCPSCGYAGEHQSYDVSDISSSLDGKKKRRRKNKTQKGSGGGGFSELFYRRIIPVLLVLLIILIILLFRISW